MCSSFHYNTHFLAEDFQSTVVVLLTQRPANTWKDNISSTMSGAVIIIFHLGINFEHFHLSIPMCSAAQEVHNVPFFPLQYTFSSRGLSKHSGCTTNSEAGQHVKRESKSRSYCKGSASFLSLSMYHKPQWLEGGWKLKSKAKADDIVKALPPFSLFLCTTSHSG